ncbi:DUF72 domain-containing protein [Hymenobacter psychrotolerans]|uniref:Uncharacterized conserved protein YecE, DUF72 family n=1 Tax=Hymenobacter psychrotolerans DSM 18569 TaxID=1121959 RepID=A0A1M6PGB8_9BACT|nr:DUF72 domain-containing protein [Hymenobacter psychrotolerans]SHK06998.1 Uncharacterized conserved protein YecE, DUF72 family [Hymenobacter psychrotolerans DSM 18569]
MDFGRLSDLRYVDFRLPPDHPNTAAMLARAPAPEQQELFIGCPIWTNKAWLGSYFPAGIKEADYLHHYARQFNSLELNTTHYRIPDAPTVRKWRDAVPAGFRFCPKLPQVISHDRALYNTDDLTNAFCRSIQELNDRLGWCFLQLPPHFGPENLSRLERYLLDFPANIPLAVELRHPAWYSDKTAFAAVAAMLEALNKTLVIADVAGRRDVLHMRLTTPTAFIRFNGHGLINSDYQRADFWAERIAGWLQQGLHTMYFFVHQKDIMHTPVWTQYFLDRLQALTGLAVPPPRIIPQPVQGSLF